MAEVQKGLCCDRQAAFSAIGENYSLCSQGWKWGERRFLWSPGDPTIPGPALAPTCFKMTLPCSWVTCETRERSYPCLKEGHCSTRASRSSGSSTAASRSENKHPRARRQISLVVQAGLLPAIQGLEPGVGQTLGLVPGKAQTRTGLKARALGSIPHMPADQSLQVSGSFLSTATRGQESQRPPGPPQLTAQTERFPTERPCVRKGSPSVDDNTEVWKAWVGWMAGGGLGLRDRGKGADLEI